jgi:hypothetical protein
MAEGEFKGTHMNLLRRSALISTLDRETNGYIRGKKDARDTILGDITGKQRILSGLA